MTGGELIRGDGLAAWVASCGLLSLRIMPVFLFAPPFTLTRVPRLFVGLMSLGFAIMLVSALPASARLAHVDSTVLAVGALREITLGLVPVVALQLLFGALYMIGRTIDVQAGFGLAMLIDPQTRGQVPLAGTIFAYAAGVTFFAAGGHLAVLRFFAASLRAVPLAAPHGPASPATLLAYAGTVTLVALGVGALVIATLLLADVVVAMLSRTVPQMNALLLGIQVKAAALLLVMPIALGFSGALFARLVAAAIDVMPRLV
ncbi:MAG: flagellar biosynthetic protein FliR [Sphingomonadales bacterium]|nr:flagellar biosynthetic protein FliR [Sphingomonadales bacterium]